MRLTQGVQPIPAAVVELGRPSATPSPSQVRWHREELAMFVHLGMNTMTGREWGTGDEDPALFDPVALDARQWARLARETGFGTLILTAKHHDGFCLWPTATTGHGVAASPWRGGGGDVVAEAAEACRAEGVRFGVYCSPWDRNAPSYGSGAAYDDLYAAQLTELLTGYGDIAQVWFDGAVGESDAGRQRYDWPRIHALVRRLQPDAVIFSDAGPDVRWVGNESGVASLTSWNTIDPALVPEPGRNDPWTVDALSTGVPGGVWRPPECDVSIRSGWFWHASEDDAVRDAAGLWRLYLSTVGRGSKLLLNVPPNADGLIADADAAALRGFAALRREALDADLLASATVSLDARVPGAATTRADARDADAAGAHPFLAGALVVTPPAVVQADLLSLAEHIDEGQHVAAYRVEVDDGSGAGWRRSTRAPPSATAASWRSRRPASPACG